MTPIHASLILLLASGLVGCVPYPAYKTIQPESQMAVLDERNEPVEGAKVELIANFSPHGRQTRETKITDLHGVAAFEMRSEWQSESMMMHGVKYYFWNWCIQKPGFKTYLTGGTSGNKFDEHATIQLSRGASSECPAPLGF
jgi:hypothetical protein